LEEENQRLKMLLDGALENNRILTEQFNRKLASVKQNNDELNESLAELNKTNDVLQKELRDFQVRSFKDLSRDTWRPMEDRAVQEALEILHKDIEDWADENCIESLTDIACDVNSPEARELLDCLRKVAWISEEETELSAQLQQYAEVEIEPVLLLTALLTYAIYKSAFSEPFLILDALEPQGPPIVDSSGTMNLAPQWPPMRKSELLQSTFEKLRESRYSKLSYSFEADPPSKRETSASMALTNDEDSPSQSPNWKVPGSGARQQSNLCVRTLVLQGHSRPIRK
jgi:hypothetical protein